MPYFLGFYPIVMRQVRIVLRPEPGRDGGRTPQKCGWLFPIEWSLLVSFSPSSFGGLSGNLAASLGGQLAFPRSASQLSEMNRVRILFFLLFHSNTENLSPLAVLKARMS